MQISMVFSLGEKNSAGVSGYYPIHKTAKKNAIPFVKFQMINDEKTIKQLKLIAPDYIFVVGLSQLVGKDVLECALKGVIGLHPTALPKFRGRAPMVWQILLGAHESKITLFLMNQEMDAGDIIGQEPYVINETDYAEDLDHKGLIALRSLTKRVLSQIKTDTIMPVKQNESEATYLLKRTPEDGQIDWSLPCERIQCLIRAVSRPFPGAYSYYEGVKVVF
jgi:methionyl-tRNA formyltransferase